MLWRIMGDLLGCLFIYVLDKAEIICQQTFALFVRFQMECRIRRKKP